mmetsp:Transcript_56787/g.182449  ORF Transcript_56787/g.182449 Transcript_56787/m.182449 type:complete len:337 (-) Transcript_56787:88-1098(-)
MRTSAASRRAAATRVAAAAARRMPGAWAAPPRDPGPCPPRAVQRPLLGLASAPWWRARQPRLLLGPQCRGPATPPRRGQSCTWRPASSSRSRSGGRAPFSHCAADLAPSSWRWNLKLSPAQPPRARSCTTPPWSKRRGQPSAGKAPSASSEASPALQPMGLQGAGRWCCWLRRPRRPASLVAARGARWASPAEPPCPDEHRLLPCLHRRLSAAAQQTPHAAAPSAVAPRGRRHPGRMLPLQGPGRSQSALLRSCCAAHPDCLLLRPCHPCCCCACHCSSPCCGASRLHHGGCHASGKSAAPAQGCCCPRPPFRLCCPGCSHGRLCHPCCGSCRPCC